MTTTTTNPTSPEPFLVFQSTTSSNSTRATSNDVPIYFEEDWNTGIGGGLWSTGLAFAKYLTTPHAAQTLSELAATTTTTASSRQGLSVLELGSGNSFLSVCILGLAQQIEQQQQLQQRSSNSNSSSTPPQRIIQDLVITDLADHLPLMQKTVDANTHILSSTGDNTKRRVCVMEHKWGEFLPTTTTNNNNNSAKEDTTFEAQVQQGSHKFDLILGSDVAYRPDLFDILIASLLQYSHDKTIILIGVTMLDTNPTFFHKLRAAGFEYTKFSDHLLEPNFRGPTFGIFCIQRQQYNKE